MVRRRSASFNAIAWDVEQYLRTEAVARRIEAIYREAIEEAVRIGLLVGMDRRGQDVPFSFDHLPQARLRTDRMLQLFAARLMVLIQQGQEEAWLFASKKNDAMVQAIMGKSNLPKQVLERYGNRNLEALSAFQKRKVGGLGLSERVWRRAEQLEQELAMSLDLGLGEGMSAEQLSREVRQHLNQPERLFRRYRDKRGALQLSKNAKSCHPGQGVYRSSYKNAMRLTRTEVNMSYRESDHVRWQQLDFIVGFEVRKSNNHPAPDICDELAGRYPKTFKFTSWHPHCRCHTVPIFATEGEIDQLERMLLSGQDTSRFGSVNAVRSVPASFRSWVNGNRDRIARAKSKPLFVVDNLDEHLRFVG